MTKARGLTKEEEYWIKDNLRYDPETGYLWWIKQNIGSGIPKNLFKPAGYLNRGYISIESSSKGIRFRHGAHRLAWLLYYGVWPKKQIDHINGVRDDNRIVNLREATNAENSKNRKPRVGCSSRYKGVSLDKRFGKWEVKIKVNYKSIYLGRYDNEEEAALAYNEAALKIFGGYAKINVLEPLDTSVTNTYISSSSGELTC